MSTFITILGTAGAIALLIAYGMVSSSRLSGDGVAYQAINLGGALTLAINSGYHGAWPSAILNVIWTAIGALAIGKFIAKRAAARAAKGA
ncbi:hypothetical protein GCM10009555_055590 [Acrocarpospora macrocephala]|uniref:CBU-0592-like domain-containing protein n=1 Tax=Acrocarpospora macrocephala TaxID=150177 RepID=A0A5M3WVP2_9ACTN|nr:hypothetical protein [Acrocarpospora macrocephala]GES10623.1 hypothetical protein Amac_042200 [Acrocarpospora macrocephala]